MSYSVRLQDFVDAASNSFRLRIVLASVSFACVVPLAVLLSSLGFPRSLTVAGMLLGILPAQYLAFCVVKRFEAGKKRGKEVTDHPVVDVKRDVILSVGRGRDIESHLIIQALLLNWARRDAAQTLTIGHRQVLYQLSDCANLQRSALEIRIEGQSLRVDENLPGRADLLRPRLQSYTTSTFSMTDLDAGIEPVLRVSNLNRFIQLQSYLAGSVMDRLKWKGRFEDSIKQPTVALIHKDLVEAQNIQRAVFKQLLATSLIRSQQIGSAAAVEEQRPGPRFQVGPGVTSVAHTLPLEGERLS